jgi:N-acetylmuramoyl-L-alanine amidase
MRLVICVHTRPRGSIVRLSSDHGRGGFREGADSTKGNHSGRPSLTRELGLKINHIVVDPGHSGYETDTIGLHGQLEKERCLDVTLRLGQLIQESTSGADVIYSRTYDLHVPLEERTTIANPANANLFISIQANSCDSQQTHGVETY